MIPRIAAIDLFCGCGGMTRGFLDAGISVIAGVDVDPKLKETYEKNNSPAKFIEGDIVDIHGNDVFKAFDRSEWDFVVITGCAPCQPFSSLRRKSGRGKDASL